MTLEGAVKDAVLAKLDHLIFTEDVQLSDATRTLAQIAIVGPEAGRVVASVLDRVSLEELASLREHDNRRAAFGGHPVIVTRVNDTGEPGFELFVDREEAEPLTSTLAAAGVSPLDPETIEALRIEGGVPRFRRDMDEETIPLEAGIESRALSFTKGCYVGQEVIVRVMHRGHGRVARKLVGLTLTGAAVPAPGAIVGREGADVGHVTSSTMSPALACPIALAYVHRDSVEPGTELVVDGRPAVVTRLPFYGP
jgi:folate-binding protein YgfZ